MSVAKSVLIFIPAFGQMVSTTTLLATHGLQQAFASKGIGGGISAISYPDIADIRNIALSLWYDTVPNTHLLFVDADMGFEPQVVLDMLMFDEPLVGAMYPKRTTPLQWAGAGTGDAEIETRAGFMRVAGVGMGCTLIRKDLVTTMLEKMPGLSDERLAMHAARDTITSAGGKRIIRAFDKIDDEKDGPLSEDLSFCRRWRECGGQVWASTQHKMTHVGPWPFEGCYAKDAVSSTPKFSTEKKMLMT